MTRVVWLAALVGGVGASSVAWGAAAGDTGGEGPNGSTVSTLPPGSSPAANQVTPRPETAVKALPRLPARADEVRTDSGFPSTALQLGGGVSEFSAGEMRSEATRGPYWDLRAVIGLRRLLAFEAAFTGAAYPLVGSRYGEEALLLRNGFEAGPRLNLPVERKAGLLLLYGTAGLGLANYRLARSAGPNPMSTSSDFAATVPLAAGLTMGYERFLVDVRIGYRFTFRDQMASPRVLPPGELPDENRLRDYSFGVQVGYEL